MNIRALMLRWQTLEPDRCQVETSLGGFAIKEYKHWPISLTGWTSAWEVLLGGVTDAIDLHSWRWQVWSDPPPAGKHKPVTYSAVVSVYKDHEWVSVCSEHQEHAAIALLEAYLELLESDRPSSV